jgi:hypothetical protein
MPGSLWFQGATPFLSKFPTPLVPAASRSTSSRGGGTFRRRAVVRRTQRAATDELAGLGNRGAFDSVKLDKDKVGTQHRA